MESVQRICPPNPCENANFLSKLLFIWTIPFFNKGYKQVLNIGDIYQTLACDKSEPLGNRLEMNWNKKRSNGKESSLLSVIWITFWKDYALLSVFSFFNDIVFRLGQPFLLGYLLDYFRKKDVTETQAMMYASGIVMLNALNALVLNQTYHLAFHNGMKTRVAVCSLIYRKSLRLSQTALGETSPGKVVNLLSNDVNRFDWASLFINSLWVSPLLTFIIGCLLWDKVRFAGLIGILAVFTIVPILGYAGKLTSKYRLKTAIWTDERVRFMDEIISGVQVIKMYAWEKPFAKLVSYARQLELKFVRKTSYIRAIHMTSTLFTTRMAIFCTMLAIAFFDGPEHITAAKIFVISSYFGIVSHMMSQRFSRAIAETSEVLVALKRLDKFLNLDEKIMELEHTNRNDTGDEVKLPTSEETTVIEDPNVCISMKNVRAHWTMPSNENLVYSSNGKSKGKLNSNRQTEQNALLQNPDTQTTMTQTLTLDNLNIEFPKRKLIGVIGPVGAGKSSLLQVLLRELPLESGSISIRGSISYASQEPWVFAASVRQNILFGQKYDCDRYNAVIKTCALTKDFEQLENGDLTIVGERGASLSGGQKARLSLARACFRDADIYLFDDPLSAVDTHVGTHIFNKCIGPNSQLGNRRKTRILVTHQVHFLKEADWLIVLKDGKVEIQGSPADLYNSDIDFIELIGMVETPEVRENIEPFNRHSSETLSRQSSTSSSLNGSVDQKSLKESENKETDKGVQMEASSKGTVKGSVSLNYFKAGAHWTVLVILLFSFIFVQFLASVIDYWVSVWIKQEEMRKNPLQDSSLPLSTEQCIYIQSSLIAALLVFAMTRSIGFYSICVRISQNLHNAMFEGLISTSMRFFDTNPSGRILNRFSKDLGAIDEFLPKSILDSVQNILNMLGLVTVATVVNPYFLLPVVVLSIFFIFMRKIYLKTSKSLKRLEGIVKSPAFTHLGATLNGLSTVRAYNTQAILTRELDNLQDTHSACWYMSIATTSMFGLSLDIMSTTFIACIIFYYMIFETDVPGEKIGLAVSQVISLTGLVPWGVRQSAEVSNQMMAVERVLKYRDLEPEIQPKNPKVVIDEWPSKGRIEFRNVFYRYSAETKPVFSGLSFIFNPMEKIGIVGRTGAGKSSLIGALFRLAHVEGEILIDDIDTAHIQLSELRKHISIIPQDPVLFSGTLRRNLDPFDEYSDADIWSALESVELKDVISDVFGLQSPVLPHGSNFSDPQTDLLIQQTIREKFIECTVLTVAHRMHTIIDSDRVIVMDAGKAIEFDRPHHLLQNRKSIFCGMVNALGNQEFDRLVQIAQEKFDSHGDNDPIGNYT